MINTIQPYSPIPTAKQYVSSTSCECGCQLMLNDYSHAETVCYNCGLVQDTLPELSMRTLNYGGWSTSKPYSGSGYTRDEKRFMKQKGIKTRTYPDRQEINMIDYQYTIDTFKHDLCLSNIDIQEVWDIIRKCGNLKKIHPRLSYSQILLGVCRYVLSQRQVIPYLLNLSNSIYREYNLSRKDYNIIERNIKRNLEELTCNT